MRRRPSFVCAGALALTLAGASGAGPASAEPRPTPLAGNLLSPLSLAVSGDGSVWFTENYAGVLRHRGNDGRVTTPAREPGDLELSGVSEEDGTVWYVVTGRGHTVGRLHELAPDGGDRVVADLYAHERQTNADHDVRYGFRTLPAGCAAEVPRDGRGSYPGAAETHPVATLRAHGATYVADAAANTVVAVNGAGVATTVAVLPAVRTTMTRAYAEENGFPDCTIGRDYWAEPVPTDVEPGPDGSLYVTTLPGGPGELHGEPAGAVLRVLILTGQVTRVAGGLDSPVGLAVSDDGDLYVSELRADRISRVDPATGAATAYWRTIFPGDVETTRYGLVFSRDVLSGTAGAADDPPLGQVIRLN